MVLSRAIANNIYTICGTPSLEWRFHRTGIFRQPVGQAIRLESCRSGMVNMVTYSDLFSFVIMICAIIALIKNEKEPHERRTFQPQ